MISTKEKIVNDNENYIEVKSQVIDDKDFLFKQYYQDVNKVPLLSREEEEKLSRMAKLGDEYARERLVSANLRFVISVAKKYQNKGLSLMDLIAEGNMGLLTAIEKFDPDMGFHFISYAVWWIKQSIMKAISEKSRLIRLPLNRANDLIHIERIIEEAENSGFDYSTEDIAKKLDLDKEKVEEILNISKEYLSFDHKVSDSSDSATLADFISDSLESPEDYAEDLHFKQSIQDILETLTQREKDVISLRFGLTGDEPKSLQEIGNIYQLTKERIRQIEKKALRKLKHPTRIKKIKELVQVA